MEPWPDSWAIGMFRVVESSWPGCACHTRSFGNQVMMVGQLGSLLASSGSLSRDSGVYETATLSTTLANAWVVGRIPDVNGANSVVSPGHDSSGRCTWFG